MTDEQYRKAGRILRGNSDAREMLRWMWNQADTDAVQEAFFAHFIAHAHAALQSVAPEERFVKDAARYRKLVCQATEGDWGGFVGWRLTVDIPACADNIDDAIDAHFRLPTPQPSSSTGEK